MDNVSKKEFWIGIALALVALAGTIMIEPSIRDRFQDNIKLYEQALRVENDANMFAYAQKTNVGNVLAIGDLVALQPQSISEIQGTYAVIQKVKEHYTRHTRQDCSTDTEGNTHCTTVVYYTWDHVHTDVWASPDYDYLSVKFSAGKLNLPSAQRLILTADTMGPQYAGFYDQWNLYEESLFGRPTGDDRYEFNVLPVSFAATMFVQFLNGSALEPISQREQLTVYANLTPQQVIEQKKVDIIVFQITYYFFALLIVLAGWYWLSYSKLDIE